MWLSLFPKGCFFCLFSCRMPIEVYSLHFCAQVWRSEEMPRRAFWNLVFIMCTYVQLEFLLCLHGGGRETFCSALAFQIGQSALPLPLPWLLLSCFGSSVSAGVTPCHDNYSLHAVQLVCLLSLRLGCELPLACVAPCWHLLLSKSLILRSRLQLQICSEHRRFHVWGEHPSRSAGLP